MKAVAEGVADAGHLRDGAEDEVRSGVIQLTQAGEEASGERLAIFPRAPRVDQPRTACGPAVWEHHRDWIVSRNSILHRFFDGIPHRPQQNQPCTRGIVTKPDARRRQTFGRNLSVRRGLVRFDLTTPDDGFEHLRGDSPRPEDRHSAAGDTEADHGGFKANRGGASVEHGIDASVEICQHMRGSSWAGVAEAVCTGRRDGDTGGLNQREADWMRRHADAHERAPRGDLVWDGRCARQQQSQRSRPEGVHQTRGLWSGPCDCCQHGAVGNMDDQGIPVGTLLGYEDRLDRLAREGIRPETVYGLRGEGDHAAATQEVCCTLEVGGQASVEPHGFWREIHMPMVLRTWAWSGSAPYTPRMQSAEIELKFPVPSLPELQHRLRELGFVLDTVRTFEQNTLYDTDSRMLRGRGELLRLRQYGERHILTHKRHPDEEDAGSRYKVRIETESEVADGAALASIFTRLGFSPVFRYEKFRSEYSEPSMPDAHLVVDETPIGIYAELEGPPWWIDRTLQALGVHATQCLTESYGKLFLRWKQSTGSAASDLTFDEVAAPELSLR